MDIKELEKIVKKIIKPAWIQETFKVTDQAGQISVYLKSTEHSPKSNSVRNLFSSLRKTEDPFPKIACFCITAMVEEKKQTVFISYFRVALGTGTATYQLRAVWITEPDHRFINLTHFKDGDAIITIASLASQSPKGYIQAKTDQEGAYVDSLYTPESITDREKESILEAAKPLSFTESLISLETYTAEELTILEARIQCLKNKKEVQALVNTLIEQLKGIDHEPLRHIAEAFPEALNLVDIEESPSLIDAQLEALHRLATAFKELFK